MGGKYNAAIPNFCISINIKINVYLYWLLFITIRFCRCIQIRNLHKVYNSKKASCRAVNSLQMTLYENQILALLGKCSITIF